MTSHVEATLILLHGFDKTGGFHQISIGVHMGDNATAENIGKNEFNTKTHSVNSYPCNDPNILIFTEEIETPLGNVTDAGDISKTIVGKILQDKTYLKGLDVFRSEFILGIPDVEEGEPVIKECLTVEALNNEIHELLDTVIEDLPNSEIQHAAMRHMQIGPYFFQAEEDVVIRREAVRREVVNRLRL